jgi:hypothetical protein
VPCAALGSFGRTGLRVHGAGALHGGRRSGTSDLPLTAGLLLLGWSSDGRGLGGAVSFRRGVVVHAPHVVVQVPSTRESEARNGTVTSLPQAEVGVVPVSMESVSFALVAEQACVGGETQLGFQAGGDLAAVGFQVGIQILARVDS